MPRTDGAPPLTVAYRRAHVLAFWLVGSVIAFVAIGTVAGATGAAAPWGWAAAVVSAVVVPGVFWRPWFESAVWIWNGSTRRIAAGLQLYVLAIAYVVLFGVVGRNGSAMALTLPAGADRSGWIPRRASAPIDPGQASSGDALRDLARAGHVWALCLVPLVFVLRLLRSEDAGAAPPPATYTLY